MSSYTEIDTALLDLDFTNPRIQNYLQNYPEESRSGELLAMLLGTGTDSCASLKESIKEHGGNYCKSLSGWQIRSYRG